MRNFFPSLSLVCLETANVVDSKEVVKGKETIIDFWTTSCKRCPGELDKLDIAAQDTRNAKINFISICCDKLDVARSMIDQKEKPRWSHMRHYFIDATEKEKAKEWLGFHGVPFSLAVDKDGRICEKGGTGTFDLDQALLLLEHPTFLCSKHKKCERENVTKIFKSDWMSQETQQPPKLECRGVLVERIFALNEDF